MLPTALLIGRTKVGKSSQIISSFGGGCLYIATERNAVAPAYDPKINPTDWRPRLGDDYFECLSLDDPCGEVLSVVNANAGKLGKRFGAVCLDTLTSLADRAMPYIEATSTDKDLKKYGGKYQKLYDRMQEIVWRLMELNVIVVATAHEREPDVFEGKFRPGGVELPGKLVRKMPSLFDLVLRCRTELHRGQKRRVFECDSLNDEFVTGDRYGVMAPIEPLDLPSAMRRVLWAQEGRWDLVRQEKAAIDAAAANGKSSGTSPF